MGRKHAIVLAAGMGTRINYVLGILAKQFIRINSMELFLYPITALWSNGVDFFTVVTNPVIMDQVDNIMKRHSSFLGYEYELTFNPYPNSLNGNSMIIGLKHIVKYIRHKPILLTVSDHIFDPGMVSELMENIGKGDIIVLGDPHPVAVDIDEATKILANKEYMIIDIGKQLTRYNYIDTGLFIINNPEKFIKIFDERKPVKLSDMINHKNILAYVKPLTKQYIWKDIDVFEDFKVLLGNDLRNIIIKYKELMYSSRNT